MRIVIAMMKHETNTFSPVRTNLARFEEWGVQRGEGVIRAYGHTAMPIAAYLKIARELGAEVTTPIATEAMPSGAVERATYEAIAGPIVDAVAAGCDAVMLDLHGAMVAEDFPDGEGELLARIRRVRPDVPICVTCDLHCNLTAQMVENCDALIGYKTYPHIDMYQVAEQVGRILAGKLRGECDPVMAWGNVPVLAQTLRMGSDDEPMQSIQLAARAAERDGVLAATFFGGFPMADIHDAGVSSVVIADRDRAKAEAVRDDLLARAWAQRAEFVYQHRELGATVLAAKRLQNSIPIGKPVLLLDHADNVGSGGSEDVMTVIAEVLRQDLPDVAVAAVWDPEAVRQMRDAGLGARVTLKLGGRTEMPTVRRRGEPLTIAGTVRSLTDGKWIVRGPMYTGVQVETGPTAVLDTGRMQIVVVSRHHEPWDTGIFTNNGIDPASRKYLILKSRIHYRAGFAPLASHTFTCDGHGVTTSDNAILTFKNVRRPIYPLDPM